MPPAKGSVNNPLEGPGDYDVTTVVHSDTYPAISPLTGGPTGKSVFVAGASRGIGLAIAISFAHSGASQIAIAARSSLTTQKESIIAAAKKAGRNEPKVLAIALDITSNESVQDAAQLVESEFGKLDIIINNAGVISEFSPVADSTPDLWWKTLNVNLNGVYLVTRAFLPLLLKGGDKTIVTTSSVGAHLTSPGNSSYQISKTAVMRLMEFIDAEYRAQGVVAFSFHPGNVITEIWEGLGNEAMARFKSITVDTVELAGDTVTYLTREPRQWIGGRYINCTWDMPELLGKEDDIVKGDKLKSRLVF